MYFTTQQSGRQRNLSYADAASRQYVVDDHYVSSAMGPQTGLPASPSGGLACAIAALAERQQMPGESSMSTTNGNISSFNMLQGSTRFYNRVGGEMNSYPSTDNVNEVLSGDTVTLTMVDGEWGINNGPEMTEAATSYASSVATEDGSRLSLSRPDDNDGSLQSATDPIVPESFEEQMMLAMAVSLVEVRAMSSGQSASW